MFLVTVNSLRIEEMHYMYMQLHLSTPIQLFIYSFIAE